MTTTLAAFAEASTAILTGLFFTFSVVVMPALARRPPGEAAAVMIQINRTIQNPLFLSVFLGAPIAAVVLAVLRDLAVPSTVAAGAVVVGSLALTMGVNVPMNNALDASDPATEEGRVLWAGYLRRWTGGTTCARWPA